MLLRLLLARQDPVIDPLLTGSLHMRRPHVQKLMHCKLMLHCFTKNSPTLVRTRSSKSAVQTRPVFVAQAQCCRTHCCNDLLMRAGGGGWGLGTGGGGEGWTFLGADTALSCSHSLCMPNKCHKIRQALETFGPRCQPRLNHTRNPV